MRHHGRKWSDTKSSKVDHRYCWQHGRRTDSRDWYSQRRNRCHRWRHPHIKESFHVGWLWIGNQSIENRQSNRFYPHTLTSTLTIFRFGCQTVRQESEGVRVRKEKSFLLISCILASRLRQERGRETIKKVQLSWYRFGCPCFLRVCSYIIEIQLLKAVL